MIRVLLVDDDALVRSGLRMMLAGAKHLEVVAEAADGREVLGAVDRHRPDVVLMDIGMPVLDGVGATRLIADHDPDVRVVVLTGAVDGRVAEALEAGATAVVLKDAEVDEVLDSIRSAPARGSGAVAAAGGRAMLSRREREVLGLLSAGRTNRQIAEALGITERTVKAHLGEVYRAAGASDRVQAALWGREHLARHGS
jgi:DNA-binding NarL/FixJ family response regulator